jgi:hypothetical protein
MHWTDILLTLHEKEADFSDISFFPACFLPNKPASLFSCGN